MPVLVQAALLQTIPPIPQEVWNYGFAAVLLVSWMYWYLYRKVPADDRSQQQEVERLIKSHDAEVLRMISQWNEERRLTGERHAADVAALIHSHEASMERIAKSVDALRTEMTDRFNRYFSSDRPV